MVDMVAFAGKHRSGLLGLVMLCILLASVAAAQSLVSAYGAPARRGSDIMRTIRSQKLDSYWKEDLSRDWYLIEDRKGEALGYRQVIRRKAPDGFSGADEIVYPREGHHIENWYISSDATRGRYLAISDTSSGGTDKTQITLKDGLVTVAKAGPNVLGDAQHRAPDNYVPEGLLPLAIAEAARLGRPASFKTIENKYAIVEGMVYFPLVTVTPKGPKEVSVKFAGLGDKNESVYHIDDRGRIAAIEYGRGAVIEKLVSFRQLTKIFPQAEQEDQENIPPQEPPADDSEGDGDPAVDASLSD